MLRVTNLTITTMLLVVAAWSCRNNVGFKGDQAESPPQPIVEAGGDQISAPGTQTENFSLTAKSMKVDMTWVIDNSGSMKDEIEQVRQNFSKFVRHLGEVSDLKLSLISLVSDQHDAARQYYSGEYPMEIPKDIPSSVELIHANQMVRSKDSLTLAAAAACPPNTSDYERNLLCNLDLEKSGLIAGRGMFTHGHDFRKVKGSLNGFYRADAKRIYVFVTDDDAESITKDNFLDLIAPYKLGITPTIYGFVGLNKESGACRIDKVGESYIALAQETGGMTYDICDVDWSQHFSDLTGHVKSVIRSEFQLKSTPSKVVRVSVDGRDLKAGEYNLDGNKIRINPQAVAATSAFVEVEYM